MTMTQAVEEIDQFYRSYIEAFNRGDAAGMSAYLALPFVMVAGSEVASFADEAAATGLYRRMLDDIGQAGWSHSSVESLEIAPTGARGAMLIATAVRHRHDGSVMARGKACYALAREPGSGWRITALIVDFRSAFLGD